MPVIIAGTELVNWQLRMFCALVPVIPNFFSSLVRHHLQLEPIVIETKSLHMEVGEVVAQI
jgi:hypothetical protein